MTKVDEGHATLTSLARTYGQLALSNANEAETRLKVIDDVVFSVLGWQKQDVSVEERVSEDGNTRFADYIIRTASLVSHIFRTTPATIGSQRGPVATAS